MKCEELYKQLYNRDADHVSFCPYRISPFGAHIDHQLGIINGLAKDRGISIAYSPKHNGVVELQSINFPGKRAQFHVSAIPDVKVGDWADHCRGAALILSRKYKLTVGLSGVIEGTLPIGGLSSSASVIIVFLSALAAVNGIQLDPWDTIMMAKAAENEYVGVNCGKLDQSCEVLCKKDQLLYLEENSDGSIERMESKGNNSICRSVKITDAARGKIAGCPVSNIILTYAYDGTYQLIYTELTLLGASYNEIKQKLETVYGEGITYETDMGYQIVSWEGTNNTTVALYTESDGLDFSLIYGRTDATEILQNCLAPANPDDVSGL